MKFSPKWRLKDGSVQQFYGPRNGALYVRDLGDGEKGVPLYPMLFGGGQERSYRPGTENTPVRFRHYCPKVSNASNYPFLVFNR